MNRIEWNFYYRIARHIRAHGTFPKWCTPIKLGSGIEKVAYEIPEVPGWVIKVGGGVHEPEHETYHKIPAEVRPRTVFLPLRTHADKTRVQIQESCRTLAGCGMAIMPAPSLGALYHEVKTALVDAGVSDLHAGNLGFSVARGYLVCLDWGCYERERTWWRLRYRWRRRSPEEVEAHQRARQAPTKEAAWSTRPPCPGAKRGTSGACATGSSSRTCAGPTGPGSGAAVMAGGACPGPSCVVYY